jgi:transposase
LNQQINAENQSKHSKKQVVNAILYVVKTGVQWRYLPQDFSPWKTFMTITANGINEVFGKCAQKNVKKKRTKCPSQALTPKARQKPLQQ